MTTAAISMMLIAFSIVAAYVAWLLSARAGAPASSGENARVPPLLIVVPVFDEAPLIERKLENLAAVEDPQARLRIAIVDGGSTDGSVALVRRWIARDGRFALLETQHRNKTAQLNHALRVYRDAEWVLVTDADALLAPDTVRQLLRVAEGDRRIGVVGASVRPAAAHALESLHWRLTGWLRDRESARGSAGIVAAPCYLTRREFLADMPADVLADDVHVACRAMLAGQRVGHGEATVTELRSPRTVAALWRHKYRKADAYLREIVRFLPATRRMPSPMRAIFLWRAVLLTIVPLLASIGSALLLTVMLRHPETAIVLAACAVSLVVKPMRSAARAVALAAVLGFVSSAALLLFPFSRQTASFPKILEPSEYQ